MGVQIPDKGLLLKRRIVTPREEFAILYNASLGDARIFLRAGKPIPSRISDFMFYPA